MWQSSYQLESIECPFSSFLRHREMKRVKTDEEALKQCIVSPLFHIDLESRTFHIDHFPLFLVKTRDRNILLCNIDTWKRPQQDKDNHSRHINIRHSPVTHSIPIPLSTTFTATRHSPSKNIKTGLDTMMMCNKQGRLRWWSLGKVGKKEVTKNCY